MRSPLFVVPGLLAVGTTAAIASGCHPGGIRNRTTNPADGGLNASDASTGHDEIAPSCSPTCQSYQACIALRCTPEYVSTDIVDRRVAMAVGSDGARVVVGTLEGSVDFDPGPDVDLTTTEVGLYVTRWNPDGSYAWTRTAALSDGTAGNVAVTADGAIVVALGGVRGEAAFPTAKGTEAFTSSSQFGDWVVWKIAGDGSPLWIRSGTGSRIRDLAVGADGTVHLVGQVSQESQSFIVKLNEDGAPIWGHTMDDLTLTGVAVGPDGSVWAAGFSWKPIDFDPDPLQVDMLHGTGRYAVIWKLAGHGQHILARSLSGAHDTFGFDVAVSDQGAVYLVGDANGTAPLGIGEGAGDSDVPSGPPRWLPDTTGYGEQDAFVMKLDGEGRALSLYLLGGESSDSAEQVVALPGGDILILGFSLSRNAVFDWRNTSVTRDLSDGRSFITRIGRDDRHLWTFAQNFGVRAETIVVESEGFVVLGAGRLVPETFDFDPGTEADTETIQPNSTFLSRFRF